MYYYIIYGWLWILATISCDRRYGYLRRISVISIFIILYVTMMFRDDSVSPDQNNYRVIFDEYVFPKTLQIKSLWYAHVDFLYGVINGLVKYVGLEYRSFIYIYSFLNLSILFFGYSRLSKILKVPLIWVLIFYYSHFFIYREMLQVRAGLAYAICLSALYFLCADRRLIFVLLVLIATLIHKSAILFMLVPLWIYIVSRRGLLPSILLTLTIVLTLNYLIPLYAQVVLGGVASQTYVLSDKSHFVGNLGILNPTLIKYLFVLVLSFFYLDIHRSKEWSIIFNVYILAAITLIGLSNYYVLGARIASLFAVVEPLIIAKLLSMGVARQENLAVKIIILFLGMISGLALLCLNIDVKNVINKYEFSTS